MPNSDFDTPEFWVVTCPGEGVPHPEQVPKKPVSKASTLICARCGLSMTYAEWLEVVKKRDGDVL
jgi:hypothetical protein